MRGTPLAAGSLVVFLWFVTAAAQTDEKAASVLAAARAALGGDARISAVRTLVVTGRTRQLRGDNLVPIEFEIQAELPDKYSRRDEFPAQDAGPTVVGFNGGALVQIPPPPKAAPDRLAGVRQDFARLMLGLFATSFSSVPLTFAYVAQAEAPQGKADVLDVKGPDAFAARLFVDSQTHLPLMITWPGPGGKVEQRLYFADYRGVDGHQFPFRLRRAAGAETTEETTFDRFRVNARVDPRRFAAGD
jgi:hypothetical protein